MVKIVDYYGNSDKLRCAGGGHAVMFTLATLVKAAGYL